MGYRGLLLNDPYKIDRMGVCMWICLFLIFLLVYFFDLIGLYKPDG
jgi:hypothetical protein